ncbi:MAG TPA: alpha/beta hydrolase [Capsulimonadaceae bacterium]|jgi:acetyl esterase/lipase
MNNIHSVAPIRIWPGFAPGETTTEAGSISDNSGNVARVTGVTAPELYVYGAEPGASKPAVIVCPGGGYSILAADLEGAEIAVWLASLGFVAAVLHYRCPDKRDGAYQDGRRALSWLRAYSADYGVDQSRVGVLGFSAGGHLVTRLASVNSERFYERVDAVDEFNCRPDFSMPIYPAYLIDNETGLATANVTPNADMPPLFLAQTRDDGHFCSKRYAEIATGVGVDVTSMVYSTGGHGYGIRLGDDVPASQWKADAEKWLGRFRTK